jgi:type IV pilus assembly protein PilN
MIKINLLPHREHKRKARAARLGILAVTSLGVGVALVAVAYVGLSASIATQEERNAFLTEENTKLDKQIAEIETLKKERQQLLDRKKVVERLQVNRGEAVLILDQLVRQVPEGIYLSAIKQEDNSITLTGYAQSNARVSTLMRSLNDSPAFEQPNLVEIKAETKSGQRANVFQLKVLITREQEDAALGGDSRKGAK